MTNPERLCAHVEVDSDGVVIDFTVADISRIESLRESGGPHGSPLSVAEYVRADVAAAAVANAPGYETAMAEANRASGLEDEVAALRAEVEALRSRVEKLRTGVEDALSVYELTANGVAQAVIGDVQDALDADVAATKGVG